MYKIEEDYTKILLSKKRRQFYVFISLFTLVCVIIAFCTPYWLQSWPRIHSEFKRLGLWEFCLNGYTARRDIKMQSFFGCWWLFAPYYDPIRDLLTPAWFQTVQAFFTLVFLLQMAINILLILYGFRIIKHPERRALTSRILFFCQIVSIILTIIPIIIFGCRCFDVYWMPRPELNWPSWSYGFAILSCFGMIFGCSTMYFIMSEDKKILDNEQYSFPTHASTKVVKNKATSLIAESANYSAV